MADIKQIQVGGTNYNIAGAAIVLEDNGTTTAGTFLAKTNQISSLVDGQLFIYKLTKNININAVNTLKINSLTAKNLDVIDNNDDSFITSYFNIGEYLIFYYSASDMKFVILNTPSNHLYNITKVYGKLYSGYGIYSASYIDMNGNGIDIHSPNDDHYFAHVKNTMAKFGGNNNYALFYGTTSHYNGTKIYIDGNGSGAWFFPNRTKIYSNTDYTNQQFAQLYLLSDSTMDGGRNGLYVNRPIHINDVNNDAHDLNGVQMEYNSSDDCLDFIFD